MDRPPDARRRPRIKGAFARGRALLVLFAVSVDLALPTGCELLSTAAAQPPPSGALVVSFISVGQGDAVLVQSGGKSSLVDAGGSEEGPIVVDFLRSQGVESLDGRIVVSSPDVDHIVGFLDVLEAYDVAAYASGDPKGTSTYNAFLHSVREKGSEVIESRASLAMDWGGTRAAA